MKQAVHRLTIRTSGKGLYDITRQVDVWASSQHVVTGLLTLHIQHTSASLAIQENADPDVIRDLNDFFTRLVPEDTRLYRHKLEGPDDMPAHIRAALTQTQLSIPIADGELGLGTWQGIYIFEHRSSPQSRTVLVHVLGE